MAVILKFILLLHGLIALSKALTVEEQFINAGYLQSICESAPSLVAGVEFDDGFVANFGNSATPQTVLVKPEITWPADSNELYTVIMFVEPDVKPPGTTVFVLWLVVNIKYNNMDNGGTIYDFLPPSPAPGTHRFTVLVLKQDDTIKDDVLAKAKQNLVSLKGFLNLQNYMDENNLVPLAGNFLTTDFKDLVKPKLF